MDPCGYLQLIIIFSASSAGLLWLEFGPKAGKSELELSLSPVCLCSKKQAGREMKKLMVQIGCIYVLKAILLVISVFARVSINTFGQFKPIPNSVLSCWSDGADYLPLLNTRVVASPSENTYLSNSVINILVLHSLSVQCLQF